jgi:hypothetical protein
LVGAGGGVGAWTEVQANSMRPPRKQLAVAFVVVGTQPELAMY